MSSTDLKVIKLSKAGSEESDLASELFHRINRVIPENQDLVCVQPTMLAGQAIKIMCEMGFSQLPVLQGTKVLGVFSFRSFSKVSARLTSDEMRQGGVVPGELRVDEFLESWEFVSTGDEWRPVIERLDRSDGLLVGSKDKLLGVLSPMDLLRYLDNIASPYVMISEIEMSLRALIRTVINEDMFPVIANRTLAGAYNSPSQEIPHTLEQMTFENYRSILSSRENWEFFENILGDNRKYISARLSLVISIRNDLFHLKRELTVSDHETISNFRDWLLNKTEQI
ncbi:hypothetical protein N8137_03865 [Porticoccaceae bacterium]|nr:hypothetical protein [Porticoccaceae bacterium]MDC1477240.1 hypothetical protein [Porticoccaceae bacterium]